MDSILNPYTPNAGASPDIVVGRDEQTVAFETLLKRLGRGKTHQSMIITGLRGVGKTVLLNEFGDIARVEHWEVLELEASKHDDTKFRRTMASLLKATLLRLSPRAKWTERGRRAAAVISSFALSVDQQGVWSLSWDVEPEDGFADHGDLGMDLTDVLVALGEVAKERDRGVALLIDEVQFLNARQLESLIQAIHKTVQRKLPITFVGAGCRRSPNSPATRNPTPNDSSSFPSSTRSTRPTLGRLSQSRLVAKACPSTRPPSNSRSRSPRATRTSSRNWASRCGRSQSGYAAFTVPDFDKFMLRAVPELVVPDVQKRGRKKKTE